MPTTFFGLFLFSLALSLIATFSTLGVLQLVRLARARMTANFVTFRPNPGGNSKARYTANFANFRSPDVLFCNPGPTGI